MQSSIRHLGLIPDGNRRFARGKSKPPWWGHEAGVRNMREFFHWVFEGWKIPVLTVYGLSSKNLSRAPVEVSRIFSLIKLGLKDAEKKDFFMMNNVRLRFIGRLHLLPKNFQSALRSAERATEANKKFFLNIAFAYDGQAEIVDAVAKGARTEEEISQKIYLGGFPPPDLIIRTSGEQRLSGFLLWGSSYSEFAFCRKKWPEFVRKDLDSILRNYEARNRRFGR
ncbi:MAG: polyprenyl diphosphate synthase [archaeon]